MKTYLFAAALGVALVGGGVAIAQPAPQSAAQGGKGNKMMKADQNGDGVITKQEMMAAVGRKFDKKDRNHDGKLDASELASHKARGARGGANSMAPEADDGE